MSTHGHQDGTLARQRERVAAQSPGEGRRRCSRRFACPTLRAAHCSRRGFTLTELLVVVAVIAILAGLSLGALQAARETAREARTRATITKLHSVVMDRYESYRTRRVPLDVVKYAELQGFNSQDARVLARLRLHALRDLMRMEMPERRSDITNGPVSGITRPGISAAFLSRYSAAGASANSSAECLYLLVTMGDPEARGKFADNELGDTDGDGYPEFVDGWGRPIYFFRWAPGFIPANDADTELQTGDPVNDHDPFDSRRVDTAAYRLVPLIYSGGPDGDSGLNALGSYTWNNNTYTTGSTSGQPTGTAHYDNIHNHRLKAK